MKEIEETRKMRKGDQHQTMMNEQKRWNDIKVQIEHNLQKVTQRKVHNIIFDSEINKWNINDSEFLSSLVGRKHIAIVIQDEKCRVFGGYIDDEIQVGCNVEQANCFMFCLKKNKKYKQMRYQQKKSVKTMMYAICPNESHVLFGFGLDSQGIFKDLCVLKKDCSGSSCCQQYAFEYGKEKHALCGRNHFNVNRIVVYQMF